MQSRSPPDQGIPSRGHGLIPADVVQAKDLNVFRLKCVPSRYGLTGIITAAIAFGEAEARETRVQNVPGIT
jgi:hypothetical protein